MPALLLLIPGFILPVIFLLTKSVTEDPGGLYHYNAAVTSQLVIAVLIRTITIAFIVTLVSLIVALPFAAAIHAVGGKLAMIMLGAVAASLFMSVIVRAYAWLALLGPGGPVQGLIELTTNGALDLELVRSRTGVVIGMVQYGVPFMVLAIWDVMNRLDNKYDQAAASLGAGPIRRWILVRLPLLAPGIGAGVTIVFITTLGYFIIPSILGSPRELMIGELISQQVGRTLNWGFAGALSAILLVITIGLLIVFGRAVRAMGRY